MPATAAAAAAGARAAAAREAERAVGGAAKMSNMDRFTIHSQLQHLQSKYPGTGNADTSRVDWGLNIQRDTLASHVGHYSRLAYFAVAENESIRRIRYRCLSDMVKPASAEADNEAAAADGVSASADNLTGKSTAGKETAGKETAKTEQETTEKSMPENDEDMAMEEGDDL